MPDLHQRQARLMLPTSAISIYKPFFFSNKISPTNKNTLKIDKKEKMDLFYASLLCLFLSFAFLSIFSLFWKNKSTTKNPLPPGKTGWPVFGETLEFMSTRKKGYPEKFVFDRIAKYSPHVFKTHLLGQKAAVFCGANGNKFLFSNNNNLVKSWWPKTIDKIFPSSNQYSPNEEAVIFRKWLPNFLKPEALQRYIGIMDDIAQKHFVEFWENKEEINVFPVSKKFTFLLACKVFVSVEDPTHVERLAERFDALAKGFATLPINFPGTTFNKAIRASNFIRNELSSIAKRRKIELAEGKASPTQDILSHMLVTSDDNGRFLNEFDIGTKILGLLVGSHDTGCCVCSAVVKYLAELPEIYQGVYKEQMEIAKSKGPGELLNWDDIQKMKYSYNVLCEVMRLTPPLQGAFKEAITDFVYKGFSIPKGWKLYWSISSTHLNPELFPDPHKFDPSRFEGSGPAPYTYVPFGGGPRMCPGKEYARLEILVFMHHLVKRFKLEKVIPDEKIYNSPLPIPVNGLPIRLYPNKH